MRTGMGALALLLIGPMAAQQAPDARAPVPLPPMMREHMLANMRDHLRTLDRIVAAMSAERYVEASRLAEERLGMSSLRAHDAEHFAQYLPKDMQAAGTAMHRAASRFALAAGDSDVDRSYQGLLRLNAALGELAATCVACHDAYRLGEP